MSAQLEIIKTLGDIARRGKLPSSIYDTDYLGVANVIISDLQHAGYEINHAEVFRRIEDKLDANHRLFTEAMEKTLAVIARLNGQGVQQ